MTKRIFDFIVATTLLILLSPILCLIALLAKFCLGAPILFRQTRPGLQGKPFDLIKFRTMAHITDDNGELLPDACRMNRLGKFLRSTSLDELPELWNVIKGDMSLVGPRPLLMEYLSLYNEKQNKRHEVRPGMTGLSQVKGRNSLSWDEKFDLDVWYIENQTLWLDIKILLLTIKTVLTREGTTAKGSVTAKKFTGNRSSDSN